jgi:hypothetical protein
VAAIIATHTSTPPVLDFTFHARYGLNENGIAFNAAVIDYVESSGPKSVVMIAKWDSYLRVSKCEPALLATVERLAANGISVYVVRDVPAYDFDVAKALFYRSWYGLDLSCIALPLADYKSATSMTDALVLELKKRGAHILDPVPILRSLGGSESVIRPFNSTGSFYSDSNHLSAHGAIAIKSVFSPLFQRQLSVSHSEWVARSQLKSMVKPEPNCHCSQD